MATTEFLERVDAAGLAPVEYVNLAGRVVDLTDVRRLGVVIPTEYRRALITFGLAIIDERGSLRHLQQAGLSEEKYYEDICLARQRLPVSTHILAGLIEERLGFWVDKSLLPKYKTATPANNLPSPEVSQNGSRKIISPEPLGANDHHQQPKAPLKDRFFKGQPILILEEFEKLQGWHPDIYRLRVQGKSHQEIAKALGLRAKDATKTPYSFYNQLLTGQGSMARYYPEVTYYARQGFGSPQIFNQMRRDRDGEYDPDLNYEVVKKICAQARQAGLLERPKRR